MPSPVGYGELMDAAAAALGRTAEIERGPAPAEIAAVARAIEAVRAGLSRQLRLAGGRQPASAETGLFELTTALAASWLPEGMPAPALPEASHAWEQAALAVGGAADLLATHFDGQGRPRSPDAAVITGPPGRAALYRRVAGLAELLAAKARTLAIRLTGDPRLAPAGEAQRLLQAAAPVWFARALPAAAAARATLGAYPAGEGGALDRLPAAEPLSALPVVDLAGALRGYDRLRRLAFLQAAGELPAGISNLRGYAALGYTLAGHAGVIEAALSARAEALQLPPSPHRHAAERAQALTGEFARLHARLGELAGPAGAPSAWRPDFDALRAQLAACTRGGAGFLPAAELVPDAASAEALTELAGRLTGPLAGFVVDQEQLASRLYGRRELLVPTAWLEDADIPTRYAPMPGSHFEALSAGYASLRAACEQLAAEPATFASAMAGTGRALTRGAARSPASTRRRTRAAQPPAVRALAR